MHYMNKPFYLIPVLSPTVIVLCDRPPAPWLTWTTALTIALILACIDTVRTYALELTHSLWLFFVMSGMLSLCSSCAPAYQRRSPVLIFIQRTITIYIAFSILSKHDGPSTLASTCNDHRSSKSSSSILLIWIIQSRWHLRLRGRRSRNIWNSRIGYNLNWTDNSIPVQTSACKITHSPFIACNRPPARAISSVHF